VRLLDRSPHGVVPTQYGRALLKRSVVVFDELKQSVQDIAYLSDPGAGEICVGSSPAQAEGLVFAILERLSRQYPRIVVRVMLGGVQELYDELRERRIELGLARMSLVPPEGIDQEALFYDPLVVVAGADNPWARRRKFTLADLLDEPWTWASLNDALIVEAFRAHGVAAPHVAVYTDAINMRIKLAAAGRFLAVVPASVLKFHDKNVSIRILPVELPMTRRQHGIITLKGRTLSPLAQRFIDIAREVAKPLAREKS
jgi:DNA-binding transcriptional LysR family regulator